MGEMNIEDLIGDLLEKSDESLDMLPGNRLTHALESYVQKQQAQAINEEVTKLLGKHQRKLIQAEQKPEKEEKGGTNGRAVEDDDLDGSDRSKENKKAKTTKDAAGKRKKGRGAQLSAEEEE